MSFTSLGLSKFLSQAVARLGYNEPTPIQLQAIPAILEGRDILAAAETGSGKTAGFALPILQQLSLVPTPQHNQAHALVLVPTRELAVQVNQAIAEYASSFPREFRSQAVYGGAAINPQMQALCKGCDIVVATPGRLLDLVQRNAIDLRSITTLVLDEADRMLDLGFAAELDSILDQLPEHKQTLLFSATFPEKVRNLTTALLSDPLDIAVKPEATLPEKLVQGAIEVDRNNRTALLKHLLREADWQQVLIFVGSKRTANNIELKFYRSGIQASILHGDLNQNERMSTLANFSAGKTRLLIATDLAARGIDIPSLPCVLNYDLPRATADYVHRAGRTARAGAAGLVISLLDHEGDAHFKLIEKRIRQKIPREQIQGFERSPEPPPELTRKKGQAPIKGKRKSKKDKLREAMALSGN